jgi:hypothetical protein
MISAQNSWIISLDNLSRMQWWVSDALCRLATGGGLATRKLYEDDSEKIFDSTRPVVINGIDELAIRDDLVDRSLIVTLSRIPEEKRKPRRQLLAAFEDTRPRILGAFLDVLASALANLDKVSIQRLPRMADFALLITAAEPGLNWPSGFFLGIYMQDRTDNAANLIESDAVAVGLQDLLKGTGEWRGTFTELLSALDSSVDLAKRQNKTWPQSAQALSNRIRHAAPALRNLGVEFTFDREPHTRRRLVTFRKSPQEKVPSVPNRPDSDSFPSVHSQVNSLEPDGASGDTGDAKLRPPIVTLKAGRGASQGDEEPQGTIMLCPSCGREFKSQLAWRIHLLTGPCKRRES